MKQITLTMMQRLNLDTLLSVQSARMDDLFTPHEIRQKVAVSRALRAEYIQPLPDGRVLVDEPGIEAVEPLTCEFENEHVRYLLKLLKEWPKFLEGDIPWLAALRKQLEG